ncbi:hypothetical protein SOPP22_15215 [Shewanella sp. OPT22]|nr:hypothetical protein SOPP22_15215 [Shewanella sp. OPT22]
MKFEQSKFQDYFSRCYESFIYIIYFLAFAFFLKKVFSFDIGLIQGLIVSALITVFTFVYIYFKFNAGSHSLEITDEKIIFKDDQYETHINQADFQGYRITRFLPHRIEIKNKVYGETSFSYYAFPPEQRRQIFKLLDAY